MAKAAGKRKGATEQSSLKVARDGSIRVRNREELALALDEARTLQEKIEPLMARATELKKGATYYAVGHKVDVVQMDGEYWRLISRTNRFWDGGMLKRLTSGKKIKRKGKKPTTLWNLITKRVPDPELINEAVNQGWVDESEIAEAFKEKQQQPFLQRYEGTAE